MRARYYNPGIGRFITEESVRGKDNDPLSLNLYTYCHNDPINYAVPTGHVIDTVADVVSLGVDVYDIIKDPKDLGNWGSLVADGVCTVIPFASGGGVIVKNSDKVVSTIKAAGGKIADGAKWLGGKISDGAKKVGDFFGGLFKKGTDKNSSGMKKVNLQLFAKKFPEGFMSGKDTVKFLKKEGFTEVSQNGSHVKLNGPNGEVVIVPVHGNRDLPKGTLNSIKKQAGY